MRKPRKFVSSHRCPQPLRYERHVYEDESLRPIGFTARLRSDPAPRKVVDCLGYPVAGFEISRDPDVYE